MDLDQWNSDRKDHLHQQDSRRHMIETGRLKDTDAMQDLLEEELNQIDWPRETDASFEVDSGGELVMIDVDLPEVEDIPDQEATVAARGLKINVKTKSAAKRLIEYMTHIHAIAFRVIGLTFGVLPIVNNVVISGYSQRADAATGNISDDYLFSIRVDRTEWTNLNFGNLSEIDLSACLGNFDIRRKMTKTGIITSINPFESAD